MTMFKNRRMHAGFTLLVLGVTLFLFSFVKTNVDTVIDVSFTVDLDEKYEPYDNPGTYYHTRVFSKYANGEKSEQCHLNFN